MKNKCLVGAVLLALCGVVPLSQGSGQCAALSLEEAVQIALVNNPDVNITRLGEETAKAKLSQARGANSFSWKASVSLGGSDVNRTGWGTSNGNRITGSLPIYSGNVKQNNIESAEIGIDIAKLQTQRKWETMQLEVIKAYYNVLEAKKQVAVYQDAVDKYQKHLSNVEQLFFAGSKAKIDVLRSQVELANAKQTLIKGESTYDNNVSTLRNLLYMDQQEPIELTDDFVYVPFESGVNECVDFALKNRKDLQVYTHTLEQKELEVKSAKAGYMPTVDLSVGAGWNKQVLPSGDNHEYSATIGASWNIFDSGVTKGKVNAAETALEIARLDCKKAENDINLTVRKDYNSMREAEKRFVSTKEAVKEAEEDYFIANEKYKAGEGIMLDIIDAQNALATAQQNYISAQYDYARYRASVESDMGYEVHPSTATVENAVLK
ncbi:MAG: TolC family protein [Anaerovibrio sp.]|uniref:TolC family protein n=1 Tax=Anaerovibrio sp. TaxID=1872532 RepID=UPI0025D29DB8|nr:TolC family protein [Anaerovibrio sp.]MCR5176222.1 TolC family protein [Anaerovibrio sp.]